MKYKVEQSDKLILDIFPALFNFVFHIQYYETLQENTKLKKR